MVPPDYLYKVYCFFAAKPHDKFIRIRGLVAFDDGVYILGMSNRRTCTSICFYLLQLIPVFTRVIAH